MNQSEQIDVSLKGVVLEDEKREVNKNGKVEILRVVLLHQRGKEKAVKIGIPVEYKRTKPNEKNEEKFEGTFYYGVLENGRLYGTLKVKDESNQVQK